MKKLRTLFLLLELGSLSALSSGILTIDVGSNDVHLSASPIFRDLEWIAPPLSRLKRINFQFQFNKMMFRDNRIKEGKVNSLSLLP